MPRAPATEHWDTTTEASIDSYPQGIGSRASWLDLEAPCGQRRAAQDDLTQEGIFGFPAIPGELCGADPMRWCGCICSGPPQDLAGTGTTTQDQSGYIIMVE